MDAVKMLEGMYKKVTITDKRDYVPGMANNGGGYIWYDIFRKSGAHHWLHSRETSGEFCPYCHSFDCAGCEEPEVIGSEGVIDFIGAAEEAGLEVEYEEE